MKLNRSFVRLPARIDNGAAAHANDGAGNDDNNRLLFSTRDLEDAPARGPNNRPVLEPPEAMDAERKLSTSARSKFKQAPQQPPDWPPSYSDKWKCPRELAPASPRRQIIMMATATAAAAPLRLVLTNN